MFLTAEELEELTSFRKASCQIRWLQENHWPFVIAGDGRPRILRDVVIARLGEPLRSSVAEPKLRLGPIP